MNIAAESVSLVGCLCGLSTSVLWTATSLLATASTRRIGPFAFNTTRILTGVTLLAITHWALTGAWLPHARGAQVAFLAISGLIGLTIGDQALFAAFMLIGPRLALLLATSSPIWAALIGWVVLGEVIPAAALLGMTITLSGIAWVITERSSGTAPLTHSTPDAGLAALRARGIALGLLAALCQSIGLLLSKQGIGHGWLPAEQHIAPQSAALLRMSFAAVGLVPLWGLMRLRGGTLIGAPVALRGSRATGFAIGATGAIFGSYLGMWMSLEASHRLPIGMAQTLSSLPPVLILPVQGLVFAERVTQRAVAGALVAVAGIAVLVLAR